MGIALLAWLPETQLRLLIVILLVLGAGVLRSSVRLALGAVAGVCDGVGIWIGQKSMTRTSQAQFRRRVLSLLVCVAMVSVVRSLLALLD